MRPGRAQERLAGAVILKALQDAAVTGPGHPRDPARDWLAQDGLGRGSVSWWCSQAGIPLEGVRMALASIIDGTFDVRLLRRGDVI